MGEPDSEVHEYMPAIPKGALAWIGQVKVVPSLQHFTRKAVNRALSYSRMISVVELDIPRHMLSYLTFESN